MRLRKNGGDRMPAVCIVRHNYYPDGHVRRDAEALAQKGYDVSVVSLRRSTQSPRETVNGVEVHRLRVEHRRGSVVRYIWEYVAFLVLAFLRVTRLHAQKRFSIVEVDNMPDVLVFSALVPKLTGARVMLYIFDNMPELLMVTRKLSHRHPAVRLLTWAESASTRFANKVLVTQEMARRVVQSRGTPENKLAVVLNCPDETIFKSEPQQERSRGSGDAFEIVTHGVILERYGVQVLIDALPKIIAQVPETRVHVFGEGEYRSELESRVRQLGMSDRVIFHGLAPMEELLAHLCRADVGYVGMLCDLMLSNKLMEYVTLSVPAVVSRWSTYEYYFPEDSVTYYKAGDPNDVARAIISVYQAPERARERASRALELYQRYRWPVQREVYLGIYSELLADQTERWQPSYPLEPSA